MNSLRFALACVALVACVACAPSRPRSVAPTASKRLALAPCTIPGLKQPAKCGTAHVFEDRALGRGRVVPLKVIVVPAAQSHALPDPVVVVVGGPGQAATEDVAGVMEELGAIGATRDFVFVDQRGMGVGSPLRCKLIDGTDLGALAGGALPESRLRACLASMDADPSLYTTSAAADDLDEVLGALGYETVNLMGSSYGTFASQTFAKMHPARVRSLVLNAVASPAEDFVLRFAENSQRVLDQTFDECAADAGCHARHPDPPSDLARAFARLRAHREQVSAEAPDGKRYTATLDANAFALAIRSSLYSASSRGDALALIHDVAEGRFETIARTLVFTALAISDMLSVGGYLSIVCAESLVGVTMEEAERVSAKSFLGTARVGPLLHACSFWPKKAPPTWLHDPVHGDLPALLLAGTMDPASPLADLELAGSHLPNAQRVIVPGEGHGVGGPCITGIIGAFLDRPLAKVDVSCVKPVVARFDAPRKD